MARNEGARWIRGFAETISGAEQPAQLAQRSRQTRAAEDSQRSGGAVVETMLTAFVSEGATVVADSSSGGVVVPARHASSSQRAHCAIAQRSYLGTASHQSGQEAGAAVVDTAGRIVVSPAAGVVATSSQDSSQGEHSSKAQRRPAGMSWHHCGQPSTGSSVPPENGVGPAVDPSAAAVGSGVGLNVISKVGSGVGIAVPPQTNSQGAHSSTSQRRSIGIASHQLGQPSSGAAVDEGGSTVVNNPGMSVGAAVDAAGRIVVCTPGNGVVRGVA
jgi:hypothetical protein